VPEAKHVLPFAQLAKRSRIDLIWGYASISGVMFWSTCNRGNRAQSVPASTL